VSDIYDEAWLAKRMLDHRGPDVFDGTTDPNIHKARFREAIKHCGLECVIIGAKARKPVNWREAFKSVYGEAL
jgi:hypothetical protein